MCNRFPRMYQHSMVAADVFQELDNSQLMNNPDTSGLMSKNTILDTEFENRFANFKRIFDPNAKIND